MKKSTDENFMPDAGKAKTYRCFDGLLGCGGIFTKEKFRFSHHENVAFERESTLCRDCELKIGFEFGVDRLDAGVVSTALGNMAFYFSRVDGGDALTEREKVRCLLLASGVRILQPSDAEEKRAQFLRSEFPSLGRAYTELPKLETVPQAFENQLPRGDR